DTNHPMNYWLVFVGGGIGAVARFFAARVIGRFANYHFGESWLAGLPLGTLLVNWLGALLIGILAEFFALKFSGDQLLSDRLRYFLVAGVLGGFTTFSAFSLESYLLLMKGDYATATAYILLSVVGTIMLVMAGTLLARAIF
ncbi:MAG: fluoride efflux transporter CrcB, partial [Hydrotalea sp.]|nr:fluoride efflux transporter CrcB [Hydrotalea sp.]